MLNIPRRCRPSCQKVQLVTARRGVVVEHPPRSGRVPKVQLSPPRGVVPVDHPPPSYSRVA